MPIAIHLRTEIESCIYRDAIIAAINSGLGDSALICSGFFQENFKNSAYQASQEVGLIQGLTKYGVTLETFGIHNGHWMPSYRNFCSNLRKNGVQLIAWKQKKFQWHAKIFLLKRKDTPIFGIIGSSNITANAFGVRNSPALSTDSPNPPSKFNFESDVYLWEKKNKQLTAALSPVLLAERRFSMSFLTRYYNNDNSGFSITNRLAELELQIRDAGLNERFDF